MITQDFRADLETFRGPVDLLLYLIKKEEVDILDIPISRITGQYLAYIQILSAVDPNNCGEFLVMAANLMEIKSKTLLPRPPEVHAEEEFEDPRLELVLQLLEYKKYKERALLLEKLSAEHGLRYRRPEAAGAALDDADGSVGLGKVSVWDLLTAFHRVQLTLKQRQPHRVLLEDRPVSEYIRMLEIRLPEEVGQGLSFATVFEDCRDRYDAIGFFLALLEMAKRGLVTIRQDDPLGEIVIARSPHPPAPAPEDEPPPPQEEQEQGASPAVETDADTP